MKTHKFKTNAKCAGCVAAIGSALDAAGLGGRWSIDLSSADKILTVESDFTDERISDMVKSAGFRAEPLGR